MISVKNFPAALMVANNAITFNCNATFIRCMTGSASMRLEAYSKGDKVIDCDGFAAGIKVGPIYVGTPNSLASGTPGAEKIVFDQVILTNGATAQQIVLWLGDGDVEDNRLIVSSSSSVVTKDIGEDTADTFGAVAVPTNDVIIHTGVSQGGSMIVQNTGSFPVALGLGALTVTFATGIVLEGKAGTANHGDSVSVSAGVTVRGIASGGASEVRIFSGKFA